MTLVHRNVSEILRLLNRALRVSFLTLSLITASMQADAESSALSSDAITQAEEHLERAALDVPQRNKQDTIQRDVQDIVFLLNQSWKAAEKSDDAGRKEYAKQALALLERSAERGYFDLGKAKPVLILIHQLLSVKG